MAELLMHSMQAVPAVSRSCFCYLSECFKSKYDDMKTQHYEHLEWLLPCLSSKPWVKVNSDETSLFSQVLENHSSF